MFNKKQHKKYYKINCEEKKNYAKQYYDRHREEKRQYYLNDKQNKRMLLRIKMLSIIKFKFNRFAIIKKHGEGGGYMICNICYWYPGYLIDIVKHKIIQHSY